MLWVRAPANESDEGSPPPTVVRSLAAFCAEHGLDEEAMLAVSRGEQDDHEGWQCGEVVEYDEAPEQEPMAAEVEELTETASKSKVKAAAKATAKSTAVEVSDDDDEAAEEGADTAEADAAPAAKTPPPVQGRKMIVGFVAPMLVLQVLKRFDQTSAEFLMGLRATYFAIVALNTLVQMILQWRIAVRNDPTPVTSFNPLAMLLGGGGNAKKTAAQYDREQLNSLRTSYRLGTLFVCFLHFKMKMTQPLVYSGVSGIVDLVFNPLVQIYLFGQAAEGAYKRPFGSAGMPAPGGGGAPPGLASLFNNSMPSLPAMK